MDRPVARLIDLVDPASQQLFDLEVEEARRRVLAADPEQVLAIRGSFALVARDGEDVRLARSLDRPLRYFLAKEEAGPMLVVAESMREILEFLRGEGYEKQFHPTYCRMVPAHHVLSLKLIGCPDPNPVHRRFFAPPRAVMAPDLEVIGERYIGALYQEVQDWLERVPAEEPLGVSFSGGIDSGSVLLALYRALLESGQSPARLKAFVLSVDGGGEDVAQAREFLRRLDLEFLLEAIEVEAADLDPFEAVTLIEDYKPLDVECAVMGINLARGLRRRYSDWRFLVDGDGGDENLKDYPIEDNEELTIRSVVN
ncbi:MAG: asparagine synthase-related protein, partial [Acidobacteriota bacterium]